jgi:hypothetical protein
VRRNTTQHVVHTYHRSQFHGGLGPHGELQGQNTDDKELPLAKEDAATPAEVPREPQEPAIAVPDPQSRQPGKSPLPAGEAIKAWRPHAVAPAT